MDDEERQRIIDHEHLRLLLWGHYISGSVTAAFALFFALMFLMAGTMLANLPPPEAADRATPGGAAPPTFIFFVFAVFASLGVIYGILEILSGRAISKRRNRTFSFIVSIPRILMMPWGTLLSVFTFIVLDRPSIRALYAKSTHSDAIDAHKDLPS
jgi:hypothetical protein